MAITTVQNVTRALFDNLSAAFVGSQAGGLFDPEGNSLTEPVPGGVPTVVTNPVVTGSPRVGQTLTATNGVWSGAPTAYTIRWQALSQGGAWTPIAGATGNTLVLTPDEEGKRVRAEVQATNATGASAWATSNGMDVTAAPEPGDIDYAVAYAYLSPETAGVGPSTALTGIGNDGAAPWDWAVAGTGAEAQKVAGGFAFANGKRMTAAGIAPDTTGGTFVVVDFTAASQGGSSAILIEGAPTTYIAARVVAVSGVSNVQIGYHNGTSATWVNLGPVAFGARTVVGIEIDDDAKTVRHYLSGGEITTLTGRAFDNRTFTSLNMGTQFDGVIHRAAIVTRAEGQAWPIAFADVIEDFTAAP